MARKRGGLAGFWDRNKRALKNIIPTVLGAVGGPVGIPMAALTRATMEGLDRPGQRGIGLDVGAYLRGAAAGAGQGATGSMARAGVQRLLAPGGAPQIGGAMPQAGMTPGAQPGQTSLTAPRAMGTPAAAPRAAGVMPSVGVTPGAQPGMTSLTAPGAMGTPAMAPRAMGAMPSVGITPGGPPPTDLSRMLTGGAPSAPRPNVPTPPAGQTFMGRLRDAALRPEVLSKSVEGLLGMLPSPETDVAAERVDIERQRLELERQMMNEELRRRQAIAQFLMPLYQQTFSQYGR